MIQLLTPLDMSAALLSERFEGEPLAAYRARILRLARVMARRDVTEADYLAVRSEELSARTGYDVLLERGADDPVLLEEAYARLFTWERLDRHSGLFRWPRPGAPGEAPLYNYGAPAVDAGGVASAGALAPYMDGERLHVTSGFFVADGRLYYLPARPRRLRVDLPPGTTETALLPYRFGPALGGGASGGVHGHRLAVVDERTLVATGADGHTHTITVTGAAGGGAGATCSPATGGTTGGTTGGDGHTHELTPVDLSGGRLFIARTSANRDIGVDADGAHTIRAGAVHLAGAGALPALATGGVRVVVDEHDVWVDPYDYYSGTFTLAAADHVHRVRDHVVEAAADGHTHTIAWEALAEERLLIPLFVAAGDTVFEEDTSGNPFFVYVREDRGWTVVSMPGGLAPGDHEGALALIADDAEALLPLPAVPARSGDLIGLGPDEEAAYVHVERAEGRRAGELLTVTFRTEDRLTGGVPFTAFYARLAPVEGAGVPEDASGGVPAGQLVALRSGADARATAALTLPPAEARQRLRLTCHFTPAGAAVSEHIIEVLPSGDAFIHGWGATPWGTDYGY